MMDLCCPIHHESIISWLKTMSRSVVFKLCYTISMIIYIGADHRGFALKEHLKTILKTDIYEVVDVGAKEVVPDDDYPVYAKLVAEKVSEAPADAKGILICGSGFGVDEMANKFPRVRSALAMSPDHVYQARHDDDANVLAMGDGLDHRMTPLVPSKSKRKRTSRRPAASMA